MITKTYKYALSTFEAAIGDGPFLFGDTPVAADASVGSVLAALAASPAETELRTRLRGSEVLMGYVAVVQAEIIFDWQVTK